MKIRGATANNHKKAFEIRTYKETFDFPYAKLDARPSSQDSIVEVFVDKELGEEAFTYRLESGREGTVHIDHVLEYNKDPAYMRELLLYRLTIEVRRRVQESGLSKREVTRRMKTSASQFYRILDEENYRKSIDQLVTLFFLLDCELEVRVKGAAESRLKGA